MAKSNLAKFDASSVSVYVESDDQFPVPFDGLWQAVGYSRKDNALRQLRSELIEGDDFISSSLRNRSSGKALTVFFLTEKAAKIFEQRARPLQSESIEKTVRDRLARKVRGKVEVACPAGRIDILSSSEVIEVKHVNQWKSAIGQVLVYKFYYPSHSPRIHLFGAVHPGVSEIISTHCKTFGITLSQEP